jgi:high affinity Mn2+ porin
LIFQEKGHVMDRFLLGSAALMTVALSDSARSADFKGPGAVTAYDWSGFYLGADVGLASGRSNWSATQPGGPNMNGSLDFFHTFGAFDGSGSHFGGLHAGYNYVLPSRLMFGVEADVSFPSTLQGEQDLSSAFIGAANYNDTIELFGTVRGRIGYDISLWLYYVTGGFAWTYDQFTRTQLTDSPTGSAPTGTVETSFLGRIGWTVGAGAEAPIAPGWTARFE